MANRIKALVGVIIGICALPIFADNCPDMSKTGTIPPGWTLIAGRMADKDNNFAKAIIPPAVGGITCIYHNNYDVPILMASGYYNPDPRFSSYWGYCPGSGGHCCMASLEKCTFVQYAE